MHLGSGTSKKVFDSFFLFHSVFTAIESHDASHTTEKWFNWNCIVRTRRIRMQKANAAEMWSNKTNIKSHCIHAIDIMCNVILLLWYYIYMKIDFPFVLAHFPRFWSPFFFVEKKQNGMFREKNVFFCLVVIFPWRCMMIFQCTW